MKRRILYIIPQSHTTSNSSYVFEVILHQIKTSNHQPHLLFIDEKNTLIEQAKRLRLAFSVIKKLNGLKRFYQWTYEMVSLRQMIRNSFFDIICCFDIRDLTISMFSTLGLKTRRIWINQDRASLYSEILSNFIPCDLVMFFSNLKKEKVKNSFGLIPPLGYWKIPKGIGELEIDNEKVKKINQTYKQQKHVVGLFTNFGPRSQCMIFFEMIRLLRAEVTQELFKKINFLVIGKAMDKKGHDNFLKAIDFCHNEQLDQQIHFLGIPENLENYFNSLDILIYTDRNNYEVQEDVLQAVLQNTLIISNDSSWPSELIQNYVTGVKFQGISVRSAHLLKEILKNYLEKKPPLDPSNVEKILISAKERVLTDYSHDKMVEKINEAFNF